MRILVSMLTIISLCGFDMAYAKDQHKTNVVSNTDTSLAIATYLGNEGVLLSNTESKVLFDPFFHNAYGSYQLVPEELRTALFSGTPPYDNISAIFVSHAHGDHFSAEDMVKYLTAFPATKLVAPEQAIAAVRNIAGSDKIIDSLVPIKLEYKDEPIQGEVGKVKYDVVRIPHAGWPQRAQISNLVFRVSLADQVTVVHMGDADPNDEHFKPLAAHWQQRHNNTAFPPYWFLSSEQGQLILKERIAADTNIGVHVPIQVPDELINSGEKYFSTPGERFSIQPR